MGLTPWLLLSAGRCDDISFAVNQREPPGNLKCDLQLFSCFTEEMIRFLGSWLWYKLSLNLVGAWYLIREQVWDRHRHLPPLIDQGGKLVVVTGGGRGIGEKAVRKLVALGCRVIVGV